MTRRGPNEGSIFERKDGRWEASLDLGWIYGKRVRKHALARTRAEASAKLDDLRRLHNAGLPIPDQRTKVGSFLRQWLEEVAKPTIRASTYESYSDIVTIHLVPGLGRIALAKLSPADVQGFLNRKAGSGLSARRVQMLHAVLRRALVTAERWGYVNRNVARLASPPRVSRHEIILVAHLIPGLGRIALAKLTPAEVQTFLNAKLAGGLSPRRVQYIHAVLRRALVTGEKWGMVSRNVAKFVDPPRVPKHEIMPLTPEQAKTLIETSVDDRHRALWITALGTGLRQGELLGLRWEDVDLDAGRLRVRHTLANVKGELTLLEPKTDRSRRTVLLADAVVTALRAHRTRQRMERLVSGSRWVESGHVFTTLHGTPYHAATITRAFQAALDRAGLPHCRFHDLRHAAATFLLAQGMTLEDVKNLLGHSSITLTSNTYGHVLEQRQRQVARAMDAVLGG